MRFVHYICLICGLAWKESPDQAVPPPGPQGWEGQCPRCQSKRTKIVKRSGGEEA